MIDLAESSRHTRWQLGFWMPLARAFAKVLFCALGPVRIRGAYRIPRKGPVLVLSNHVSDIDPILVQSACPRALHFMAKSELFDLPVIGRLQRAFGSFPVQRGAPDRAALKHSATLLQSGEGVGLFPEGQLSENGELQEIKGGVAIIIRLATDVPVICCGLNGTQHMIPYGKTIPRPAFRRVEVNWGEPRSFPKNTPSEDILAWVAAQLAELSTPL